jgi:hypothetical protein
MKKYLLFLGVLIATFTSVFAQNRPLTIASPSGKIRVKFTLTPAGEPSYSASFNGKPIIGSSKLGMFTMEQSLIKGFKVTGSLTSTKDETWKPVWGEVAQIRNHYNELMVNLQNNEGALDITFRVFDDGIGFRYGFPKMPGKSEQLTVTEEMTEFQMTGDHTAWWQAGVAAFTSVKRLFPPSSSPTMQPARHP